MAEKMIDVASPGGTLTPVINHTCLHGNHRMTLPSESPVKQKWRQKTGPISLHRMLSGCLSSRKHRRQDSSKLSRWRKKNETRPEENVGEETDADKHVTRNKKVDQQKKGLEGGEKREINAKTNTKTDHYFTTPCLGRTKPVNSLPTWLSSLLSTL